MRLSPESFTALTADDRAFAPFGSAVDGVPRSPAKGERSDWGAPYADEVATAFRSCRGLSEPFRRIG